ncbi:MAG: M20/M25/M40 family metallo-hydrolase [Gemmataceae bacterium]
MAHDASKLVNAKSATDLLMRFLAVEGVTGHEAAIGREIVAALREAGLPKSAIHFDDANARIPVPTETGNLIATLPGTVAGPRLLFMTHMDTVPLCAGAKPLRKGDRIVAAGETALGGDNRTGCAVLVTLAATLLKHGLPHPPLTFLFTVREESGLYGARHLNPADLGEPVMGFNFDGKLATDVILGAVGAERWEVEIKGKASHAGVAPEKGISATAVASLAIADAVRSGWFGKVEKSDFADSVKKSGRMADKGRGTSVEPARGTSNVGPFGGRDGRCAGDATNVVTDYVFIKGESRSHDASFAKAITAAYKAAFAKAASELTDDAGNGAKVKFASRLDYHPFRMKDDAPVVRHAAATIASLGGTPNLRVANGGLDANWIVRHKVPTVTMGAGQNAIHTVEEFVDLTEFAAGCRLAVALATHGAGA